jgi:hypothetical protein
MTIITVESCQVAGIENSFIATFMAVIDNGVIFEKLTL